VATARGQDAPEVVAVFRNVRPHDIALSSCGRYLAAAGVSADSEEVIGLLSCWQLSDKKEVFRYFSKGTALASVSFASGTSVVAAGGYGDDHDVGVWNVHTRKRLIRLPMQEKVRKLRFAADGNLLAIATPHEILLLETKEYRTVKKLLGPARLAVALAFSQDGKFLACGDASGAVYLWDVRNGKLIWRLTLAEQAVHTLCFDERRTILIAGDFAGNIHLIRNFHKEHKSIKQLKGHEGGVFSSVLTADGRSLLIGGFHEGSGTVEAWDMETLKLEKSFKAHSLPVLSMALSSNLRTLATAGNEVKVWRLPRSFLPAD
jgi:WD40 repeat protein